MTFAVWAASGSAPGHFCTDPTSRDKVYPGGDQYGQAGWDAVTGFDRATTLPQNLRSRVKGRLIDRLAINAHGNPGVFDLDSQCSSAIITTEQEVKLLSAATFPRFQTALQDTGNLLTADATILLMGCNTGRGQGGTDLLIKLSALWGAGRTVVAFSTIGFTGQASRPRTLFTDVWGGCQNPGMRDTEFESPGTSPNSQGERYGGDRKLQYEWAWEGSPHAKVVKNQKVTRNPDPSPGKDPSFLFGTWGFVVTAKKPTDPELIIFDFKSNNTVTWQGFRGRPDNAEALIPTGGRNPGSWRRGKDDLVSYEFPSDPDGFKRVFTIVKLDTASQVTTTLNGKPHNSGFTMNKRT